MRILRILRQHILLSIVANGVFCSVTWAAGDPFPAFSSLKEPVISPRNAVLSIDKDGTILLNNSPRYLFATLYYEEVPATLSRHTAGYGPELNWLYEDVLDYEGHQRLGFDATGIFASSSWIRKYRNRGDDALHDPQVRKIVHSGLPLYLDFTCAPWHHGFLKYEKGKLPVQAAFTVPGEGNNHWMPYSATTPEGRRLYLEMWRNGAEVIQKIGGKPFVYELFNEPDYNDWSSCNRKLFCERMKKKYGTIRRLNAVWHTSYRNFEEVSQFKRTKENPALFVEWTKFMEECFTDICRAGIAEIRKVDRRPDVRFCYQPMGNLTSNANLYETNRYMDIVCAPTDGGNALYARLLHAVAKGKPILDGETYIGNSRRSIRNKFWLQYARGFNGSFVFKWDRRPFDQFWPKGDEAGGKIVAERFPYLILNPYAMRTSELLGIMEAKQEILKVNELFTPRDRGIHARIATLFSLASKRLARATGSVRHMQNEEYALALGYSPFAYDAVFEEQLPEGVLDPYRVLVVAGIETSDSTTLDELEKFVHNGGILILGQEALQNDEYGFPRENNRFPGILPGEEWNMEPGKLNWNHISVTATPYRAVKFDPSVWQVECLLAGQPVILSRSIGKGKVFHINAKMPLDSLSALLKTIAAAKEVQPLCTLTDSLTGTPAMRIEVHKAVRNGLTGYIFINQGFGTQLIRFRPAEDGLDFVNPLTGKRLESQNGEYLFALEQSSSCVLVGGKPAALIGRYGELPTERFEESRQAGLALLNREKEEKNQDKRAFNVDRNKITSIDFRPYANNGFHDFATWKLKGEKGIRNTPWGVVDCNGVPFQFVRSDHNEERTCIYVNPRHVSHVKEIAVESLVKNLYFLQAATADDAEVLFRYLVNYRDGSRVEIPIRNKIESDHWKNLNRKADGCKAVPGWKNLEGEGLWLYRWQNPHPDKEISSLEVFAAPGDSGGLTGAISIELPGSPKEEFYPLRFAPKNFRPHVWGGLTATFDEDIITFHLNEKSIHWCSCAFLFEPPLDLPKGFENGMLEFEVNGGTDMWGNHRGGQTLQFRLDCLDASGKALKSGDAQMASPDAVDADPESWQLIQLPLKLLLPAEAVKLEKLFIQFMRLPQEPSGIQLRNIRLHKMPVETENKK